MKRQVKIPEVLFFQEGPGVRNTQYTTSGVKLLNVANLVNGKVDLSTSDRFISNDEAYNKYSHFLCKKGDFIIASSGIKVEYIDKKMGFITEEMLPLCMNTSTIRFRSLNHEVLNIRYFMYYLKSQHFKTQLEKHITGSAQLNYGPSHLAKMTIPLVDICVQNSIVHKLDTLSRVMDYRLTQLAKLDELVKCRFVELFGDIEVNPRRLPILPWNQVFHTTTGRLDANAMEQDGIYPFFTCAKESYRINSYAFDCEALLLAGNNAAGVYDVKHYKGKFNAYQRTYVLKLRNENWSYLLFKLQLENKLTYMQSQSKGTNTRYLTMGILNEINFIIPSVEEQQIFASFVHRVDKLRFIVEDNLSFLSLVGAFCIVDVGNKSE